MDAIQTHNNSTHGNRSKAFVFLCNEKTLSIAYGLLTVVLAFLSWWMVLSVCGHVQPKTFLLWLIPGIALEGILFVVLMMRFKKRSSNIFLLIAFPFVLLFALFIIPDQTPDEIWHIYRSFDLVLSGADMSVPASIAHTVIDFPTDYSALYNCLISPYDWSESAIVQRDLTSYLPHLYLVPHLVITLCSAISVNPFLAIFFARISNAILFIIAGYWIIKIIPLGQVVTCIYLLNPILIQQEASCSVDAMVNIASLLFVAYLLKLRFQEKISKKEWALLIVLYLFVSISKYFYALLAFLFMLFVPRIKSRNVRLSIYIGVPAIVLVGSLSVILFYQGSSFHGSIALVRNFPEFIAVMANTLYQMSALWIKEAFGMILGALNIVVWEPCFWAYMLILLFSIVFNLGEKRSFKRPEKYFLVCLAIVMTVLLILVFREWTLNVDMRSDIIMGVQGRYFIPYFLLLLLCAISPRSSLFRPNCMVLYSFILISILLVDLTTIVFAFK